MDLRKLLELVKSGRVDQEIKKKYLDGCTASQFIDLDLRTQL